MSEEPVSADTLDAALCEVCAKPLPAGARPVRVGACEFPFHVHPECAEHLGPVASEVEQLCAWANDQPEGLLWLGSWDPLAGEGQEGDARPNG